MISFCLFNQAGGSAKTTSAMMVADALSQTTIGKGKDKRSASVLIIDADPQRSSYKWESRRLHSEFPRFPVRVEPVFGLPSIADWQKKVLDILTDLEGVDYLVIDTPPNLQSPELEAVLQFADVCVMPFQCHIKNIEALEELVPYLASIAAKRAVPMVTRLLVARYTLRRAAEKEIFENIEQLSPWPVLNTRLKDLVAYSDAMTYHTSLYALPKSKEARDTANLLAAELIELGRSVEAAREAAEEVAQ